MDCPQQLFHICSYSLDLTCQKLCQNEKLVDCFFLVSLPNLLPQNTPSPPAGFRPSFTRSPGTYTSLYKHFISFDVCLSALMCLKGLFKVRGHLPWVLSRAFSISSRLITLGTLLASSVFVNTVWHSLCVLSSSEGDLLRSSDSCQCVVPCNRSLCNKERGRQWHSDCPVYHETNREEVMSYAGLTEARERGWDVDRA